MKLGGTGFGLFGGVRGGEGVIRKN